MKGNGVGALKLKKKTGKPQVKTVKVMEETKNDKIIPISDQKTPSQLAFEAAQQKKQREKLSLLASKSHKEKVAEFNEYLGKLSEHHDIPKVGPG
jgi:protein FAM32A